MKKVLLALALALSFGPLTTGCASKKRVTKLEAELLRCQEAKQRLQNSEIERGGDAGDTTVAARTEGCCQ